MTLPPDAMAPAKVPANLPELVKTAFQRARASGDVHFFPTQVTLLNVNSVPFQLRYSPSLASKPKAPLPPSPTTESNPSSSSSTTIDPNNPTKKPFFDPFDDPPPAMLITPLPPSHILVLNKFAVVPEHFILATTAFREQTHLLEKDDLDVAYKCIETYHTYHLRHPDEHTHDGDVQATATEGDNNPPAKYPGGKESQEEGEGEGEGELFVFFNSGPHSGSSQPHRHIQLLPVARMHEGLEREGPRGETGWAVLARGLLFGSGEEGKEGGVRAKMPFATFAERISSKSNLQGIYLRLYHRACEAVLGSADAGSEIQQRDGEAKISYNLAMTRDVMVIVPRVAEGQTVTTPAAKHGLARRAVGTLALNGTVLAGTALVKSQEEWDALRQEPEQLLEILGRIGVPAIQAPSLL